MRVISDELYANLIKELAKNETVAIFQQLILSPKTEDEKTDETKTQESKK